MKIVIKKESENNIQTFNFSQQMLDRIALKYMYDSQAQPYEAKYVLMKAPDEEGLFISSLELSINGDEKMEKISILRLMAIFKVLFMNNLKKTEDVL